MKKLLLTSKGIVPEIRNDFLSLLTKPPAETKVAFITTAAYGEDKDPIWLQKDRELLYACGIRQVEDLDLKGKIQVELEQILFDKDIIFVNGGNTFYLLYWARKSGFDKLIPGYLKRGGLYVGVSAGSYLLCPSIEMAGWKNLDRNRFGVTDLTGLNIVPFLIYVHFEEKYRRAVQQGAKTTNYPLVALTNHQAILVQNDKIKLIGKGNKEFWNGFKEV